MRPHVFIHTNQRQLVAPWSRRTRCAAQSPARDQFDIEIIHHGDYPFFAARTKASSTCAAGCKRPWRNDDLQSFTPLRFMPPELMGYAGPGACIVDPDVFAVGDIWELLTRDMGGKAIMCRRRRHEARSAAATRPPSCCWTAPSSRHWRAEAQFDELFAFKRDYIGLDRLQLRGPGDASARSRPSGTISTG